MLVDFLTKRKQQPIIRLINKQINRTLKTEERKKIFEWMNEKEENFTGFMELYKSEQKKARYKSFHAIRKRLRR